MNLESNLVCPKCKKELNKDGEVLKCSSCSSTFSKARGVWDLRTVLSDTKTGWDAEDFDRIYEISDKGFKDRTGNANSLGIPLIADAYLDSEKEGKIKDFIQEEKPSTVLDLGCSFGWFSFEMSERCPESHFYGVDISTFRARLFQEQISARKCTDKMLSASANAEALPFADNLFNVIVMDEVIEHLQNPSKAMVESVRVLKPGGHLIITTPSLFMTKFWKVFAIVPTFLKRLLKGESLVRKRTIKLHEELLISSAMKTLFASSGLEIIRWEKVIFFTHESYLQYIPVPLIRILLLIARLIGKIPFLGFLGLHHFIILKKK